MRTARPHFAAAPPSFAMMIPNASWFETAGTASGPLKELTAAHASRASSGISRAPCAFPAAAGPPTNAPADRCHRSFPAQPAPTS